MSKISPLFFFIILFFSLFFLLYSILPNMFIWVPNLLLEDCLGFSFPPATVTPIELSIESLVRGLLLIALSFYIWHWMLKVSLSSSNRLKDFSWLPLEALLYCAPTVETFASFLQRVDLLHNLNINILLIFKRLPVLSGVSTLYRNFHNPLPTATCIWLVEYGVSS